MNLVTTRICIFAIFLMVFRPVHAQTEGPHYVGDSPRDFVAGFYAWYAPRASNDDTTSGWNDTLRLIRSEMSPELNKLLEEDASAQSECKDLIALDFDPFLSTQEPSEHYRVDGVIRMKTTYRANIYRVDAGKRAAKPDVSAEFIRRDGHWFFVNFYYSGGGDLLTLLKSRPPCTTPRDRNGK